MADEEINGWGTFATTSLTLKVIDFTPPSITADDPVRTTTNSNGDVDGGIHSDEPSQFFEIGETAITIPHSVTTEGEVLALINQKETGTLTSKSGAVIAGIGWFKSYTTDSNSPADRPTASVMWHNYQGVSGETPTTFTAGA
jgi:hypothetical protein